MNFLKGDRVKHPNKPDWGIGEVLEDVGDRIARIFFVEAGEKKISLELVSLTKIRREPHPILDNLHISKKKHRGLKFYVDGFLKTFPEGFEGQKYHKLGEGQ